jgi:hypothetical protein
VIKAPAGTTEIEDGQFLGKSKNGVYLATIHATCQLRVWSLTDSSGKIDWALKHDIDLEPLSKVWLHDLKVFEKTWTMVEDDVHLYPYYYDDYDDDEDDYDNDDDDDDADDDDDDDDDDNDDDEDEEEEEGEEVETEEEEQEEGDKEEGVQKESNEMVTSEDHEWNSDNDNFLNIEDYDTGYTSNFTFLGFHPYKEVVFLELAPLVGVAYHLESSKVQYLGTMRPKNYNKSPSNGIYEVFPYTPCMIGELLEHVSEDPRIH